MHRHDISPATFALFRDNQYAFAFWRQMEKQNASAGWVKVESLFEKGKKKSFQH